MDCGYSTLASTIGVGDVVAPGECGVGSGDKFQAGKGIAKKKQSHSFDYSQPLPIIVYAQTKK